VGANDRIEGVVHVAVDPVHSANSRDRVFEGAE
jgi:hypothetical protein